MQSLYPIQGPLRDLLLILEFLIVLLFIEMACLFFINNRRNQINERNNQEKAYISLFLGYGVCWIVFIIRDYYTYPNIRDFLFSLVLLLVIPFAIIYFYFMERDQIFYKQYLFTKVALINTFLFIILLGLEFNYATVIGFILFIIEISIFFTIYIKGLYENKFIREIESNFILKIITLTLGTFLLGIGFLLTSHPFISNYGLHLRVYGDLLQLIGAACLYLFFRFVPPLNEYSWREKINNVYIMLKSGVSIYHKSFRGTEMTLEEQHSTAAIKVINDMLGKLTDIEGISTIEKKNKIFFIQPSEYITGVLICDAKLTTYKTLLNRFITQIEKIYSDLFQNWGLDNKLFDPIDDIAKEIFLF